MTNKESKRLGWKKWPEPVKAAIDLANRHCGAAYNGPESLAEILGLSVVAIYAWKKEVPPLHALRLWRKFGIHPSVTCPSSYPQTLFEKDNPE